MSQDIQTEVWHHCRAKTGTKMVMLCIADNAADVDRVARIDPRDIAEKCNIMPRWVKYQINLLEEMREIEKLEANTYRVRRYMGSGPLADTELTLSEHPYREGPERGGDIKSATRQQAIRAKRPRARRRT